MSKKITPTGREIHFSRSELIVSKTDLKGRLTYVNQLFCSLPAIARANLLGAAA